MLHRIWMTALLLSLSLLTGAVPVKMEINSDWEFCQERIGIWYPATVPGVVHTDLIDNGIIEDPFFRLN